MMNFDEAAADLATLTPAEQDETIAPPDPQDPPHPEYDPQEWDEYENMVREEERRWRDTEREINWLWRTR